MHVSHKINRDGRDWVISYTATHPDGKLEQGESGRFKTRAAANREVQRRGYVIDSRMADGYIRPRGF